MHSSSSPDTTGEKCWNDNKYVLWLICIVKIDSQRNVTLNDKHEMQDLMREVHFEQNMSMIVCLSAIYQLVLVTSM